MHRLPGTPDPKVSVTMTQPIYKYSNCLIVKSSHLLVLLLYSFPPLCFWFLSEEGCTLCRVSAHVEETNYCTQQHPETSEENHNKRSNGANRTKFGVQNILHAQVILLLTNLHVTYYHYKSQFKFPTNFCTD